METFEFRLPDLAEGLTEVAIRSVFVKTGQSVSEDTPLFEIETDKSTVEISSPVTGRVNLLHVRAGDTARVGDVLVTFELKDVRPATGTTSREETFPRQANANSNSSMGVRISEESQDHAPSAAVLAAPATRALARTLNVDLTRLTGSGPDGLILPKDVSAAHDSTERYQTSERRSFTRAGLALEELPLPSFERWGPVERSAMTRARKVTAERMTLAARLIPHVTHFDSVDVTDLMRLIHESRKGADPKGAVLTLTSFLVRAAAGALARHPQFNASVDMRAGEIIIKRYCNIGIAVETEQGLFVPVIREVGSKSVNTIAQELASLRTRLRAGHAIAQKYCEGGTFTITNVGTVRGTGNISIINPPEVAILGVSKAREQPVIRNRRAVARLQLPISMTFDHRVADGADAARFTADIAYQLEEPRGLLSEQIQNRS